MNSSMPQSKDMGEGPPPAFKRETVLSKPHIPCEAHENLPKGQNEYPAQSMY